MKKLFFLLTIVSFLIVSCEKDELTNNSNSNKSVNVDGEEFFMSVNPIENKILNFIERMDLVRDNPNYEGSDEWNYSLDSVKWYCEATLNYKYCNPDIFNYSIDTTIDLTSTYQMDDDEYMTMVEIVETYDLIKSELSNIYNLIEDDYKTPLTIDISKIEEETFYYDICIGIGTIELEEYEEVLLSNSVPYINADTYINKIARANMPAVTNIPTGGRRLFTDQKTKRRYPWNHINIYDVTSNNGYLDYFLFYSNAHGPNYHTKLTNAEINFYGSTGVPYIVQDYFQSNPSRDLINFTTKDTYYGSGAAWPSPTEPHHILDIKHGVFAGYTFSNTSTL